MANRFVGEVVLPFDGRDYTMVLDFNALAEVEEVSRRNAFDFIRDVETGVASVSDLRACMRAALRRHHPDVTSLLAGDILSGHPDAVTVAIAAAIAPKADLPPGKLNRANPGRAFHFLISWKAMLRQAWMRRPSGL